MACWNLVLQLRQVGSRWAVQEDENAAITAKSGETHIYIKRDKKVGGVCWEFNVNGRTLAAPGFCTQSVFL